MRAHGATLLAATVALAGCAAFPDGVAEFQRRSVAAQSAFFAQERYQCGPAALATVLLAAGVVTTPAELVPQVYIPALQGSLREEIVATIRRYERIPYRIDGNLDAVHAELAAGRPVLIMQNLGVSWMPRWHYAVVTAYDAQTDQWQLRSGTDARRATPTRTLLHTWRRSGYWGLIALRDNELPAKLDDTRFARELLALEETGHPELADTAWATFAQREGDAPIALFGYAHAELRNQRYARAITLFQRMIVLDETMVPAWNNLALAYLGDGQYVRATQTIRAARKRFTGTLYDDQLADTARQIEAQRQALQ